MGDRESVEVHPTRWEKVVCHQSRIEMSLEEEKTEELTKQVPSPGCHCEVLRFLLVTGTAVTSLAEEWDAKAVSDSLPD